MKRLNSKREYADAIKVLSLIKKGAKKVMLQPIDDVFGTKIYGEGTPYNKISVFGIEKYDDGILHLEANFGEINVNLKFENVLKAENYCRRNGVELI